MRRQIKAVLFDLDGVIVFTDRYHFRAWKRLCEEEGWEFDEELNHRLRGIPRMASLQVILDHNDLTLAEPEKRAFAERKNGYYRAMLGQMDSSDLYPGAVEFLEALQAEGVKLGLCSSSKNAMTVLEALDLTGQFDAVVTGNDVTRAKPDPQIFQIASERLCVPPFHCLVFEDAPSGIEAAHSAGMKCIGVGSRDVLPDAPECVTAYDEIDLDALLDAGRTHNPPAEPWTLAETAPEPDRAAYWGAVLALSNGYLGVRGVCAEEDEGPGDGGYPATFVNGIYDYEPYEFVVRFPGYPERRHAVVNLCDWRIIDLQVDGELFSPSRGELSQYRRELDMRRGVLRRELVWTSPAGKRVRIATTRLASMTRKHNAAVRYAVSPLDEDLRLTFESKFRGKVRSNMLPGDRTELVERGSEGRTDYFLYRTRSAPFHVAIALAHSLPDGRGESKHFDADAGDVLVDRREVDVRAGETVVLEKHVCFHTTLETEREQLVAQALAGVREAREVGFGELLAEQESWWERHWETGDVRIEGNPADQQAMRFALFHLRQSNPECEERSISANGLTGDAYSGHVFWDTEMYISPYFLYTDPAAVRPLLLYRHGILERARERARQMDGTGALYSWNSISGEECGVVYEAATAEYHLVSDIALCVARYVDAAGDREFLREFGAEIVFETARFLADRGCFVPLRGGQFCINAVCGPDEYACGVNNNCYTNVLARWHLRYAARVYEEMQQEEPGRFKELTERIGLEAAEPALWRRAADRMYVPFNDELGIHEQDDSFLYLDPVDMERVPRNTDIRWGMHPLNLWRMQVIKQADVVLLMFVRGEEFGQEVKRANYEFYEPLTCHGSSLSASIHSIIASEIGKRKDAYDYFRQSLRLDLDDFKGNTGGGLHMACMGGTWMAVVNGFAGMRDYESGLQFDPWLPGQWDAYSFKVLYRGRRIEVDVGAEEVSYTLVSGDPLTFTSSGETIELSPARPSVTCGTRGGCG